jgi:tRNA U34 5-methylaminomethyl-2-thiouridine-forming methyltransferase MnmC
MTLEVVSTEDGSITCRDARTGELYHNRAGAYTEALRNYVEPCNLAHIVGGKKDLTVLDVCFGLGYNTFVLADKLLEGLESISASQEFELNVRAIDRDPNIVTILPSVLADDRLKKIAGLAKPFENFDSKDADSLVCNFRAAKFFSLDLLIKFVDLRKEAQDLVRQGEQFDLVFHDGFSPKHMPELWTYEIFARYAQLIGEHGMILTYSSASAVRGALRECGLTVMRTAGVGGKSGGTAAAHACVLKENPFVFPLTEDEEARLNSRSAIPYRDPQLSDTAEGIRERRASELSASDLPPYKESI